MNKKAQRICLIPAALVGFAVMIYCFAANVGGDTPLVYALGAMLVTFLVLYLLVGKRINAKEAPAGARVDLRKHLTEEEIKILLSDLQVASDKVPADQKVALDALAKKLAKKSASAIRLQKKVINKYVFGQEMMDYYVDEQAVMVEASNLPDFTEAVYAFCEKRKPEFNKKA